MSKVVIEMTVGDLHEGVSTLLGLIAKALKPESKFKIGLEIESDELLTADVHIGKADLQQMITSMKSDLEHSEG